MTVITFAHRGGAGDRPENSVEAFRRALALGARGVESDVRLSGDGEPVLAHGGTVRRGLRRLKVANTGAGELSACGVPRLADLYEVVGTEGHVSLDLKDPAAGLATLEVAGERGTLDRLWLCSPDLAVLTALRAAEPRVHLVHSTTRRALTDNVERHAATLAEAGIDAFNLHRTEWSLGLVVLFHRFGVRAFAWDVQEERHFREVLAYGVDAVYSDHVERMVSLVQRWEAQRAGPR